MLVTTAFHDEGHGYDLFGFHPATAARVARVVAPLYDRYFRVRSHGNERVPAGRAILVANHSGVLPIDAVMLWLDILRHTGRLARVVADRFVPRLPFVGTWMARTGAISGSRANVRCLLERDELLAIFPEGVTGVAKPRAQQYQLQAWRVGHVELAIRHQAPVVPVAIIGAEESWPMLLRIGALHPFGAPYLPVPASPLPLPVSYEIYYGAPIELHRGLAADRADDPDVLAEAAARSRAALEALIAHGLAERRSRRP